MSLSGLLRRIDLAEGDVLMMLNQTIDLLQQVQTAVGHVLDARDISGSTSGSITEDTTSRRAGRQARRQAEQLQLQREHLEHLRPLLAQASSSLLHGIIIQSRTVPSIVARVGDETVPLDAEEDIAPEDIVEEV
jgi:hypothetical protein